MTPALQQAIRLLQLSNLELADAVADALDSNPLLREASAADPEPAAADLARPPEKPAADSAVRLGRGGAIPVAKGLWQGRPWRRGGGREPADSLDWADTVAGQPSLREHAAAQAAMLLADAGERLIADRLIGELDSFGWCTAAPGDIAAELGVGVSQVEAVFTALRRMEPAGLFARSLGDCLALQLEDRGEMTPPLRALLDNLDLLGDGDLLRLADLCGVPVDRVDGLVAQLRHLTPHPGALFAEEAVETRVPDLLLRPAPGGGWTLELNPETLPRMMVDRAYAAELRAGRLSSDERRFVREQVQAASWLVRALEQRATTLLTVAAEALRRQEHWLADPAAPRRPLAMGDLGAALDMHVSTVSRAVAGKHVATPGGLIALRDCFVGGLATATGGVSAGEVQQALGALIEAETAPLSDAALTRALNDAGIPVARRTVAKYREELGIPSSAQRRQKLKSGNLSKA
jgi:RNA polymerase sigma-54 factor